MLLRAAFVQIIRSTACGLRRLGSRDRSWAHGVSKPRYQQVFLVLRSIFADSTELPEGNRTRSRCLCECSVCSPGLTCGQLFISMHMCCICVLHVPVPSRNSCSASLLGWNWTWISVAVPDSALLSDKKTLGTNPRKTAVKVGNKQALSTGR